MPTYKEVFVAPKLSLVACLMKKPTLPSERVSYDYDSSASDAVNLKKKTAYLIGELIVLKCLSLRIRVMKSTPRMMVIMNLKTMISGRKRIAPKEQLPRRLVLIQVEIASSEHMDMSVFR